MSFTSKITKICEINNIQSCLLPTRFHGKDRVSAVIHQYIMSVPPPFPSSDSSAQIPTQHHHNRWRKTEMAKGRKQNFSMIENYADIELLIPTLIQYLAML